eukprot:scaffold183063_cov19-Prasinocladus_malaysianus.AAC.1
MFHARKCCGSMLAALNTAMYLMQCGVGYTFTKITWQTDMMDTGITLGNPDQRAKRNMSHLNLQTLKGS